MRGCSKIKRKGESCPLNNKCRYPGCRIEELDELSVVVIDYIGMVKFKKEDKK